MKVDLTLYVTNDTSIFPKGVRKVLEKRESGSGPTIGVAGEFPISIFPIVKPLEDFIEAVGETGVIEDRSYPFLIEINIHVDKKEMSVETQRIEGLDRMDKDVRIALVIGISLAHIIAAFLSSLIAVEEAFEEQKQQRMVSDEIEEAIRELMENLGKKKGGGNETVH